MKQSLFSCSKGLVLVILSFCVFGYVLWVKFCFVIMITNNWLWSWSWSASIALAPYSSIWKYDVLAVAWVAAAGLLSIYGLAFG